MEKKEDDLLQATVNYAAFLMEQKSKDPEMVAAIAELLNVIYNY